MGTGGRPQPLQTTHSTVLGWYSRPTLTNQSPVPANAYWVRPTRACPGKRRTFHIARLRLSVSRHVGQEIQRVSAANWRILLVQRRRLALVARQSPSTRTRSQRLLHRAVPRRPRTGEDHPLTTTIQHSRRRTVWFVVSSSTPEQQLYARTTPKYRQLPRAYFLGLRSSRPLGRAHSFLVDTGHPVTVTALGPIRSFTIIVLATVVKNIFTPARVIRFSSSRT